MKKVLTIAKTEADWGLEVAINSIEKECPDIHFEVIEKVDEGTINKIKDNGVDCVIIRDIYDDSNASRSRMVLPVSNFLRKKGFSGMILACANYIFTSCSDYSKQEYEKAGINGIISGVGIRYHGAKENTEALKNGLRANGYNF